MTTHEKNIEGILQRFDEEFKYEFTGLTAKEKQWTKNFLRTSLTSLLDGVEEEIANNQRLVLSVEESNKLPLARKALEDLANTAYNQALEDCIKIINNVKS